MVQDIPLILRQIRKSFLPLRQVGATTVTITSGTPVPGGYAKTGLVFALSPIVTRENRSL